ncbi:MAG: insulinase family protein [Sulfurospirillum sp.]|nr:insulinase family protein [Sulfurospirillum sp.]MBL0703058.1 insulinase family protein [Sulfurospirillum sp.]
MKYLIIAIILQGVLVSATIERVKINGVEIPIVYEQNSALPIVSLQLVVKSAGSMQDSGKDGLAKFTANMLTEGTKKKGSVEFAQELENRAISLSVNAGTETFVYEISLLKEQYNFGMKMFKELLNEPNFSKQSYKKIQQLMLGRLSSKKSNFDYIANINLKSIIFKDTPLGHPFGGSEDSIKKIKLVDIENFYNTYIDLSNMIIVVGGDIDIDEVKSSLKTLLESVKVGEKRELSHFSVNEKIDEKIEVKETEQAYIYFGAPYNLKNNDKDIHMSRVAGFILGESGFGSRLMEEVRVKRGLAYSVYSKTNISQSSSYFSGYLQTKNENLKDAKKLVIAEIKKFTKDGVTQNELNQAKKFLLGSEPLRNETLSQRLNRAFFEYYSGFELGHSKAELEKIEALSLKDLNRFIKAHDEITELSFSIVYDGK